LNEQLANTQSANKVVSDSPGLVDFAIGLVNSVRNLRASEVFWEIQITEELQSMLLIKNFFWLLKRLLG